MTALLRFVVPGVFLALACLFALPCAAEISANYKNGGAIVIGTANDTCNSTITGGLRWSSVNTTFEMCDGTSWRKIAATAAASDCTPDAFSFTDVTGQSLSSLILSNTLNITGIDVDCVVSVSGSGSPEISVNGGTWAAASTINPGDSLRVRQVSSSVVSTARVAAVLVGATTDNWSVTTRAGQLGIFLTANTYSPNMGGLAGADSICQAEAATFGYSGSYKAVLSDDATHAKDRLTLAYPIVRASDGTTVVSASNLWNGSLSNAISASAVEARTGTDSGGFTNGDHCSNWTASHGNPVNLCRGASNSSTAAWIANLCGNSYGCSGTMYLYCVQQ